MTSERNDAVTRRDFRRELQPIINPGTVYEPTCVHKDVIDPGRSDIAALDSEPRDLGEIGCNPEIGLRVTIAADLHLASCVFDKGSRGENGAGVFASRHGTVDNLARCAQRRDVAPHSRCCLAHHVPVRFEASTEEIIRYSVLNHSGIEIWLRHREF